jgi:hypothetical protein
MPQQAVNPGGSTGAASHPGTLILIGAEVPHYLEISIRFLLSNSAL